MRAAGCCLSTLTTAETTTTATAISPINSNKRVSFTPNSCAYPWGNYPKNTFAELSNYFNSQWVQSASKNIKLLLYDTQPQAWYILLHLYHNMYYPKIGNSLQSNIYMFMNTNTLKQIRCMSLLHWFPSPCLSLLHEYFVEESGLADTDSKPSWVLVPIKI